MLQRQSIEFSPEMDAVKRIHTGRRVSWLTSTADEWLIKGSNLPRYFFLPPNFLQDFVPSRISLHQYDAVQVLSAQSGYPNRCKSLSENWIHPKTFYRVPIRVPKNKYQIWKFWVIQICMGNRIFLQVMEVTWILYGWPALGQTLQHLKKIIKQHQTRTEEFTERNVVP